MNVPHFSIFYSWQSYIGGYANRSYIREKIKGYANTKVDTLNITIDEDSRGVPGASDIPENILKKIAACDIFICDITPVVDIETSEGNKRGIPNPNVMFELGFAVRHLGWDRILCILNSEYGNVEYLPFDIAKHKIVTYKKKDGERKAENSLDLSYSLNDIIDHYGDIISKANEFDYIKHDIAIFENLMSLRSEREFLISINNFKESFRYNSWESKGWDKIRFFHDYPENRFINKELNEKFSELSKALSLLYSGTAKFIFTANDEHWEFELPDKTYTPEESERIAQTHMYAMRKLPYPKDESDESLRAFYDQSDLEINSIVKACDNVITKYEEFRGAVKRILII